jgi:hypothetical protein
MQRILLFVLVFLFLPFGNPLAIDVPLPPIDIDISNSSFEKIDSTQFRIRQLIAPDYSGSYWVDFLWNPDLLNFEPTNVDEETSTYGKHRVAIVDKSGKYYSSPVAAMDDIDSWCGTPSEMNPCLVKILPGVYDIGSNYLQMSHYVDIEGSGENVTKIIGNGSLGVVSGAQNSAIRSLTIEHTGEGSSHAIAMHMFQSDPSLKDMTIISKGNNSVNYGVLLDNDYCFRGNSKLWC